MKESKKLKIRFSFDDGRKEDLKLVRLLADYDFENVIFYIPPLECGISERDIVNIGRSKYPDWKLGGHTMSHQRLTEINLEAARQEVFECRKYLMNLVGYPVDSFCYPRGWYNDDIKQIVKDAGFLEARTTKVLQLGYDDPFEMGTTIHCYQRDEDKGKDWLDVAKEWFDKAKKEGGIYHCWSHSWELSKYGEWNKFKDLLNYINENK